jgi:putative mRNA 3-end processing factor
MSSEPLIIRTARGLYCPAGDFYVDAWEGVPRNIVTHAHSDHARRGSQQYLTAKDGVDVLQHRLGADANIEGIKYGCELNHNGVHVSLHPAGHVLGSAQVRIEHRGEVWVISGDYKRRPDPTCSPFEVVPCHTFITECTFGLPVFQWDQAAGVTDDINRWWLKNRELERTSILLAYSLGKAQRVLAGLQADIGPILLHGAVHAMTRVYRGSGAVLPQALHASVENARLHRGRALVIAPPSAMNSTWARKFAPFSTGIASGWMRLRGVRRRRGADRGFVLSDHVDFPDLLKTIDQTGAARVIATHGFTDELVRLMREHGRESYAFETRFTGEEEDGPDSSDASNGEIGDLLLDGPIKEWGA